MVFHNSPDGYRGIEPFDDQVLGSTYTHDHFPPELRDGLFYRTDNDVDPLTLEAKLLNSYHSATIQDYQYWTETAWKAEHGTYPAVERFSDKLREEVSEVREAVKNLPAEGGEISQLKIEVLKECGDVLWCATALACCVSADIDSGLKNLLFRYVMGTQHAEAGRVIEPGWRGNAAALTTKYDQLEIEDISELIDEGFEPLPSPMMNIDKDGDNDSIPGHLDLLLARCMQLINSTENQFGRQRGKDEVFVLSSEFTKQARQVGEFVGQIYLELAFIADRTIEASFGDIIKANVTKLSQRITRSTVDKLDGNRGDE